ncbi:FepA family TonB-dependent siderophore receptor [Salmonella enterica]
MRVKKFIWLITVVSTGVNSPLSAAESTDDNGETMVVESTAEQVLKQQPGVSIITRDDIQKNPPVNDLADIIRKMPGVNLTGNSASGTRGNNRQIDIRGMGPENTLVLIDGVPVTSRNSVRYSWRGERDTRGDTNWVPPEMVERIEVIRGPAAARYGSGAAGGVVNIITKRPTNDWHGSLSLYTNQPESSKNKSEMSALYVEDNIEPMAGTNIIPGLRFDYLSESGSNFSPSLNLSQELGEYVKVKAGIARAFKAPNLYQTSEGYLLYSKGNGCPKDITSGGCYLVGNKNLDPEISINKEIGLEFTVDDYHASVTYFRNDYQNKIVAGDKIIGRSASGAYVLQWQNGGKALIEGIEASMTVPLMPDRLNWNTNATYMIASEQKDTGNPLSIIPKYTVNTFLDWTITSALSANVNWTLYGKQKPRTHAESRSEETKGLSGKALGAYSLVGANVNYDINKNLRLNVGISNIFDKQIYRSAEGANTYNEPGRAYYAGVTASF